MSDDHVEGYIIKRSLEELLSTTRKRKRSHNLQSGLKSKRLKQSFDFLDLNNATKSNENSLVSSQISLVQHSLPNHDLTTLNDAIVSSSTPKGNDENRNLQSIHAQNQMRIFIESSDSYDIEWDVTTSIPRTIDSSFNDQCLQNISFNFSDTAVNQVPGQNDFTKDPLDTSIKISNSTRNVSPHENAISSNELQSDKCPHGYSAEIIDGAITEMHLNLTNHLTEDTSPSASVALSIDSEGGRRDGDTVSTTAISKSPERGAKDELLSVPRYTQMIQWRNENNLCWLDAILMCTVNNCCVRDALSWHLKYDAKRENIFYRLCKTYDDCQAKCNEILLNKKTKKKSVALFKSGIVTKLRSIRAEIFNLLQTQLSLEKGKDESVVELLPNFLGLDPLVKDMFSIQLRWELDCEECSYRKVRRATTTLVSFLSTCHHFHPLHAAFSRRCFSCFAKNQQMNMIMEIVPPCLMMHFQEGLAHNLLRTLDFSIQDHLYCVTAVIQYVTSPFHHFIVWIRDNKKNKWMCCDDIKNPICTWKSHAPKIPPKQIHIVMWEKQGLISQIHFKDIEDIRQKLLTSITNQEAMLSDDDEFPLEVNNENDAIETIVLEENNDSDNPCDDETFVEEKCQISSPNLYATQKLSEHDSKTETKIHSNSECSADEGFKSRLFTTLDEGSLKSKTLSLPRDALSEIAQNDSSRTAQNTEYDSRPFSDDNTSSRLGSDVLKSFDSAVPDTRILTSEKVEPNDENQSMKLYETKSLAEFHRAEINLNSTSGCNSSIKSPEKRLVIGTVTVPSRSSNRNSAHNTASNIPSIITTDQPSIVSSLDAGNQNKSIELVDEFVMTTTKKSLSTPRRTSPETTQCSTPEECASNRRIENNGNSMVENANVSTKMLSTARNSSILLQSSSDLASDVPVSNYVRNEYMENQLEMLLQACDELQMSYASLMKMQGTGAST